MFEEILSLVEKFPELQGMFRNAKKFYENRELGSYWILEAFILGQNDVFISIKDQKSRTETEELVCSESGLREKITLICDEINSEINKKLSK